MSLHKFTFCVFTITSHGITYLGYGGVVVVGGGDGGGGDIQIAVFHKCIINKRYVSGHVEPVMTTLQWWWMQPYGIRMEEVAFRAMEEECKPVTFSHIFKCM